MQYVLCPRCKFRVQSNKHLCSTCGYVIPAAHNLRGINDDLNLRARAEKSGFWQRFFGLDVVAEDHKDPSKEEPALG